MYVLCVTDYGIFDYSQASVCIYHGSLGGPVIQAGTGRSKDQARAQAAELIMKHDIVLNAAIEKWPQLSRYRSQQQVVCNPVPPTLPPPPPPFVSNRRVSAIYDEDDEDSDVSSEVEKGLSRMKVNGQHGYCKQLQETVDELASMYRDAFGSPRKGLFEMKWEHTVEQGLACAGVSRGLGWLCACCLCVCHCKESMVWFNCHSTACMDGVRTCLAYG